MLGWAYWHFLDACPQLILGFNRNLWAKREDNFLFEFLICYFNLSTWRYGAWGFMKLFVRVEWVEFEFNEWMYLISHRTYKDENINICFGPWTIALSYF